MPCCAYKSADTRRVGVVCRAEIYDSSVFNGTVYQKPCCVAAVHHTEHTADITFCVIVAIARNGVLYAVNGVVAVIEASVEINCYIAEAYITTIYAIIAYIAYYAARIYVVTL